MKNRVLTILILIASLLSFSAFSQKEPEPESLGLPGDNLNLYAVLDIFQNSKTIEDFEKSLNEENTKINNLDLNNDGKVDFIKVITKKEGENFMFILQDEVSKNDIQDVAVVFVNKDKDKKITVQIVGDENLYGKNYIVEPVSSKNASSTVNPGYTGKETVATTTTTVVNVATSPVVVYLYSPVYVPYYPPYYYGYYPPYFRPWPPIYFSMYYHNHYHYYNHYYRPPYGHYPAHYNNYSYSRNTSVVVVNNTRNGNYKGTYNGNNYKSPSNPNTKPSTRPTTPTATSPNTRPATTPTTRPTTTPTRPTTPTTRPTTPTTTRPTTPTTRPTTPTTRPTTTNNHNRSTNANSNFSRNRGGRN